MMAFGFKVTWLISGKTVSHHWGVTPTDKEIKDLVRELNVLRYEKELIRVLKALRDGDIDAYVSWDKTFKVEHEI